MRRRFGVVFIEKRADTPYLMLPTKRQHQLIVTNRYGSKVRGSVVYVRKIRDSEAEVHIRTNDWLDPYRTPATYSTAPLSVVGYYLPLSYEMLDEKRSWLFKGTFERAEG